MNIDDPCLWTGAFIHQCCLCTAVAGNLTERDPGYWQLVYKGGDRPSLDSSLAYSDMKRWALGGSLQGQLHHAVFSTIPTGPCAGFLSSGAASLLAGLPGVWPSFISGLNFFCMRKLFFITGNKVRTKLCFYLAERWERKTTARKSAWRCYVDRVNESSYTLE